MDRETVHNLAKLSRLQLSQEEEAQAMQQISRLLGYFDMLQSVNTDAVKPSSYPIEIPHRLREDEPATALPQEEVLQNAPQQRQGHFLVPRVVEE